MLQLLMMIGNLLSCHGLGNDGSCQHLRGNPSQAWAGVGDESNFAPVHVCRWNMWIQPPVQWMKIPILLYLFELFWMWTRILGPVVWPWRQLTSRSFPPVGGPSLRQVAVAGSKMKLIDWFKLSNYVWLNCHKLPIQSIVIAWFVQIIQYVEVNWDTLRNEW